MPPKTAAGRGPRADAEGGTPVEAGLTKSKGEPRMQGYGTGRSRGGAMGRMLRRGALAVAALGVGLGAFQAGAERADDFPNRPLTMIVPFNSGGSTEIMARVLGAGLESRLGKP